MNKYLGLIVVVCVASAGLGVSLSVNFPPDFAFLNGYLEERIHTDDGVANLELIRADMGTFIGGAERAAQILIELRDGQQCSDKLLTDLVDASKAGLRLADATRIERVASAHLGRLLALCAQYTIHAAQDKLPDGNKLRLFAKTLAPTKATWPFFQGRMEKKYEITTLAYYVQKLSLEGASVDAYYFLNKYLYEPCQEWTAALGSVFVEASAMKRMEDGNNIMKLTPEFEALNFTNSVCEFAYKLNGDDKEELVKEIQI